MQEQPSSSSPGLGNIVLFGIIMALTLVVFPMVWQRIFPQPPQVAGVPAAQEKKDEKADAKAAGSAAAAHKKPEKESEKEKAKPGQPEKAANASDKEKDDKAKAAAAQQLGAAGPVKAKPAKQVNVPPQWVTLGSADPDPANPYRMLVTLSNQGASVARLELSSEHYRDLEDRGGYLGHLAMDNSDRGPGCLVQVVGKGTPAEKAGIKPGDRILEVAYRGQTTGITNAVDLEEFLRKSKPGESLDLGIQRGNARIPNQSVTLIRRPLEVIRPERQKPDTVWTPEGPPDPINGPLDAINLDQNSPLSFLTTLQRVDDNPNNLPPDIDTDAKWEAELNLEMQGVASQSANWHIESQAHDAGGAVTKVVFTCPLPAYHLTMIKTYELAKVDGDPAADADAAAYHLVLSIQIRNDDKKKHEVAYRLDGPNGLPVEGAWYVSSKVGRGWSAEGLRDVDFQLANGDVEVATATELSTKFYKTIGEASSFGEHPPKFFGVDAQYFTVAVMPKDEDGGKTTASNLQRAYAFRVGDVFALRKTLTNTTFRLISKSIPLEANATSSPQRYEIFAGPKRPQLLKKYELDGVICYGWPIFKWVAVPMTGILDFFYSILHNYGLAIILLTVVVRLAMFPVSRKQAASAQMMQQIQPKLKELEKKHKSDWKALQQARQELLAKHNYNPSSGCVLLVLQFPIFIGLYRALQVDVELRDAPLISHAVRWCSNLAAPDMLYNWSWFMPESVNNGIGFPNFPIIGGMLGMGPYLNLFPIITLLLFLLQQKVMMPPAADEQAAQQQKIMKFVMLLMGFMFFKVAAGLCIYFIATTLWGVTERRFLPKPSTAGGSGGNGDSGEDDAPPSRGPKIERMSNAQREAIRRKKRDARK